MLPSCHRSVSLLQSPLPPHHPVLPPAACGFPPYCRTAAGSWSMPLHRHPVAPLVLSPFLPLFPFFQVPSLPHLPLPSDPPQLNSMSTLSASPLGFFPLAATPEHRQGIAGWLVPQLSHWSSPGTARPWAHPIFPLASLCILPVHILTGSGGCSPGPGQEDLLVPTGAQARERSPVPGANPWQRLRDLVL